MSIALIGRGASYEFRWRRWALLRDTVAMYLEGGTSGAKFPLLASLGDSLVVGSRCVVAKELAAELAAVRAGLVGRPTTDLALGEGTAAVLYMGARLGAPRRLTDTERSQVAPVGEARDLVEYFASMFDSMIDVCSHPAEDGTIEIIDV